MFYRINTLRTVVIRKPKIIGRARCYNHNHKSIIPTQPSNQMHPWQAIGAVTGMITLGTLYHHQSSSYPSAMTTQCDLTVPSKSMPVGMLGPTVEPATQIMFPRLCNAMTFTGCGVRVKYHFIKVYAVGTYMDPLAMSAVKKESKDVIANALKDPMYPRTIRIVMNRTLSMEKYTSAICEALEPRMNGKDMDKLEEFKKMNPPGT